MLKNIYVFREKHFNVFGETRTCFQLKKRKGWKENVSGALQLPISMIYKLRNVFPYIGSLIIFKGEKAIIY